MPNYKVVNSDQLDSDITVVADAIREKSGTSGKMAFPNGMADAVRNISSGVELPELGNTAAQPTDMVAGKALYDSNGNKVSGSVTLTNRLVFSKYHASEDGIISSLEADVDEDWLTLKTPPDNHFRFMLEKGAVVEAGVFLSDLGNASPGDTAKGRTFTSSSGLKVEGTMEPGDRNHYAYNGDVVAYPEDGAVCFAHTFDKDCFYRNGEKICLNYFDLGNAAAEDVVKGKTFTTAAGVKIEGTMETQPGGGGGLPAGITEIQTGSWTQATNDSGGSFMIPHGCSKTPRYILVNSDYATSGATPSNSIHVTASVCSDNGGFADAGMFGGGRGANAGTTNVRWDNTNIEFIHMNSRRWRQGNTYTWYAICVDNWEGL